MFFFIAIIQLHSFVNTTFVLKYYLTLITITLEQITKHYKLQLPKLR